MLYLAKKEVHSILGSWLGEGEQEGERGTGLLFDLFDNFLTAHELFVAAFFFSDSLHSL